jgi:hypothetical protein
VIVCLAMGFMLENEDAEEKRLTYWVNQNAERKTRNEKTDTDYLDYWTEWMRSGKKLEPVERTVHGEGR